MHIRFIKTTCLCLGLLSVLVLSSCGGNTDTTTSGTAGSTASKTTSAAGTTSGATQQKTDVPTTTDGQTTTPDKKQDSKILSTPNVITAYDHGVSCSLTSDTVSKLVETVNKHLTADTCYYTKLYVSADTIKEIQKDQTCVELSYHSEQVLKTSKMSGAPDKFSFSKILICLSGEHSANIFFYSDDAYQSGTLKLSGDSFCSEILKIIQ